MKKDLMISKDFMKFEIILYLFDRKLLFEK